MTRTAHSLAELMTPGWRVVVEVLLRRSAARFGEGEVLFELASPRLGLHHLEALLARLAQTYLSSQGTHDFGVHCVGIEGKDPSFVGVRVLLHPKNAKSLSDAITLRVGIALRDALITLSDEIHAVGQQEIFTVERSERCEWLGDRTGESDMFRPALIRALRSEACRIVIPGVSEAPLLLCEVQAQLGEAKNLVVNGRVVALDVQSRKVKINGVASVPVSQESAGLTGNPVPGEPTAKGKRVFLCEIGSHSSKDIRLLVGEEVVAEVVELNEIVDAGLPRQTYDLTSIRASTAS